MKRECYCGHTKSQHLNWNDDASEACAHCKCDGFDEVDKS